MYFYILGFSIPFYGFMISFGVVAANFIAFLLMKKFRCDLNDFIILEAYAFLGGFVGAKLLYILVTIPISKWSYLLDPDTFNQIMQGGFVFYGGLIGGLLFVMIGARLHHIEAGRYVRSFIWLIPMIHGFGRIGCHLAGCCYGIPYHGPFAVCYHEGACAPAGIERFPVQMVEAIGLFLLAVLLLYLIGQGRNQYSLEIYMGTYSVYRFILEFFRDDAARGRFLWLSTSQWISIGIVLCMPVWITYKRKCQGILARE